MIAEERIVFGTVDGATLEGRLAIPGGAALGMVVCHPHPLYGGDLENPVVVRAVEVASELGVGTLRFNFRGVGGSSGTHGGGQAERADVRAAVGALRERLGVPALVLAGYSFGAMVAAHVATDEALDGLVLIAPPLGFPDVPALPRVPESLPVLVLAGSDDPYCPPGVLDLLRETLPGATFEVIPRANHFFFGTVYPLGEALARWMRARLAG